MGITIIPYQRPANTITVEITEEKPMFQFSWWSLERLEGVHEDLVTVVKYALSISEVDFAVVEGLRTKARQEALLKAGATTTMRSRHLTGHAVDLAPWIDGQIRWDWPPFHLIAHAMKESAYIHRIPIEWGGDWVTFKDGPHFQLPWAKYPK